MPQTAHGRRSKVTCAALNVAANPIHTSTPRRIASPTDDAPRLRESSADDPRVDQADDETGRQLHRPGPRRGRAKHATLSIAKPEQTVVERSDDDRRDRGDDDREVVDHPRPCRSRRSRATSVRNSCSSVPARSEVTSPWSYCG